MGEVDRATDTKLDRDVALKVLPEAFASDKQRMARFAREAKGAGIAQSSQHRCHLRSLNLNWFEGTEGTGTQGTSGTSGMTKTRENDHLLASSRNNSFPIRSPARGNPVGR